MSKVTLYRPVNSSELELVASSDWKRFPPRLEQQPIFYPVLNEQYARELNKWNISAYGNGYVLEFDVNSNFLQKFEIHNVGSKHHNEYWIPAEMLGEFNDNIIGNIRQI